MYYKSKYIYYLGAISVVNSNGLVVKDCSFFENDCSGLGSAIYSEFSSEISLLGNMFEGNKGNNVVY